MTRKPDDDAETPKWGAPSAVSRSGELDRDDAAPERHDDDTTPPPVDILDTLFLDPRVKNALVDAITKAWDRSTSARRMARATANELLGVEAAVQQQVANEKSGPVRKLTRDVITGLLAVVASSILGVVYNGYRDARSELNEEHDRALIDEQRISALERTIAAVIVPRISPSLLSPGLPPGKDPP